MPIPAKIKAILVVAAMAALALPLSAQSYSGRPGFDLPVRTDAGNWAGTWYYVNRDSKVVIWIREADGGPQVKLRYLNSGRGEGFETDWLGKSDYSFRGRPGTFELDLTERGETTIRGKWNWELGKGDEVRVETARITMFRSGNGRSLVLNFEDLHRYLTSNPAASIKAPQVWTFRKASNNERLWEELPF